MPKKQLSVLLIWVLLISACSLFSEKNDNDSDNGNSSDDAAIGWVNVGTGLAYRTLSVTPSNANEFSMHILRIDPNRVMFRVHYQPAQARNYPTWEAQLGPTAIAFVNASFFNENNTAIGMVIADGVLSGNTLVGYGGMFAVNGTGTPSIISLARTPYQGTGYTQAIQSFPMLIEPGGTPSSTGQGFDELARRTAIGQDTTGNIYLMSTGVFGQISLRDLQSWLVNSGLNLNAAFALDGGRSSLMYARTDPPLQIPSLANVPVILAIYERE